MAEGIACPDELNVCEISVLSGTRPCGRTVLREQSGRKRSGFLYLRDGEVQFRDAAGYALTAGTGSLLYLPKGMLYRMTYTAPATAFVLVNFELLDRSGADVCLTDTVSVMAKDSESSVIARVMLQLEQCGTSRDPSSVLRRKELLFRLFGIVSDRTSDGEQIARQIVEGVQLLRQTYLENLPIETFAKASHLSLNRFRELFRAQFGISPVKYRNRLRIERARELLTEADLTVSEVAYASGFENIGYFCRYYRKETGETPAETKAGNR